MNAPSHLKSLQALEAALRFGSLRRAADALAITPAAVGQRIKALEDYLGVDLLTRGRSGLVPTPTLAPTLMHLRIAFKELEAASEALHLQRGHEIHIAAISDLTDLWLKPRLAQFRAQHPNVSFCINGEGDAPLRLSAVDCEIGFGPVIESDARDLLFRDFVLPLGSPENRRRLGTAARSDQLEGFPLLHVDFYREDPDTPDWAQWIERNAFRRSHPERGMRFQRIAAAVDAALAHAGLALSGVAMLRPYIDDGRIVAPFPVAMGVWTGHAFQARYRADALARPQLRRFRAWLAEEARATAKWLAAFAGARTARTKTGARRPRNAEGAAGRDAGASRSRIRA